MSELKKPLALAVGVALASTFAFASTASADSSPFMAAALSSGYMASADIGEGKCGEDKAGDKAGEGSCGEDKGGEGSCGEDKGGEAAAVKTKAAKVAAVKTKAKKASVVKANAASRCKAFIALHGILRDSIEARASGPFYLCRKNNETVLASPDTADYSIG